MKSLLLFPIHPMRFLLLTCATALILWPLAIGAAQRTVLGELYSSDY